MPDETSLSQIIATESLGPLSDANVQAYLQASGDDNPVHQDDDIAAAAGFSRRPLPGMLLMVHCERLVDAVRGKQRIASLACRFLAPVHVGAVLTLSARALARHSDGSIAELLLTVSAGDGISITAQVRLAPSIS
ncbi:MaoC/PaaZ C-terminal domain-containing protein [Boseaceae bacterium BT-24-1]|nr:MaoC/PaaZ C-terminal domain-containing protein [Boseaceae bacterium BT-24-1]